MYKLFSLAALDLNHKEMNQTMIELTELSKKYGSFLAVDRLTLSIPPGEVFGFIGPNGAGKTTTIQMISGLIRPTSGRVRIKGSDMGKDPVAAKGKIGFIPDRPYLYEKLTAMEFLKFTADLFSVDKSRFNAKASALLSTFSLTQWADELIESFSHGMKQRLIMAAALVHDPEIIVVDEPMVGLDPQAITLVKQILRDFADKGGAVFLSTHTLHIAQDLCDRIGLINKGRLAALGSVSELKSVAGTDNEDLEDLFMALTK
ncbi:MAG: ABC transporter ATP-binding protein [Thermodesulfobacteriota bacterium]|nr:ABC transporter ATP-binding protein [Thermodesulfobacteriota bacterium]